MTTISKSLVYNQGPQTLIAPGRNHECSSQVRLRIFLPATPDASADLTPTAQDTFSINDCNPSQAWFRMSPPQNGFSPSSGTAWGVSWVSSRMSVILSCDLCPFVSVRRLENRVPPGPGRAESRG